MSEILEPHHPSLGRLTCITLEDCRVSKNDIVSLFRWFPNLKDLNLERPKHRLDLNDLKQTHLFLEGSLKKLQISEGEKEFIDNLERSPKLEIFTEEIVIKPSLRHNPRVSIGFINATLRLFGARAKYLRIPLSFCMCNLPYCHCVDS